VVEQGPHRDGRDLLDPARSRLVPRLDEVPEQELDVRFALAQRWDEEGHHAQPVHQVLAEAPVGDPLPQRGVGRAHDAHVDAHRFGAPDRREGLVLEHAQELGLQVEGDLGDLVEEERAPIGALEEPVSATNRPREGTPDVAEELALEQARAERGAVDRDEGQLAPQALGVYRAGGELLAGPAVSAEQHADVAWADVADQLEHALHRRVGAGHAVEVLVLQVGGPVRPGNEDLDGPFEVGAFAQGSGVLADADFAAVLGDEGQRGAVDRSEPCDSALAHAVQAAIGLEAGAAQDLVGGVAEQGLGPGRPEGHLAVGVDGEDGVLAAERSRQSQEVCFIRDVHLKQPYLPER